MCTLCPASQNTSETLVVAAVWEDSNATGINGNQSNNNALNSGAAYVFTGLGIDRRLSVERSGANVVLSWPTNVVGYILPSTTNLTSPAVWIDSMNTPAFLGTQFIVSNATSASHQFFRLIKP